MKYKFTLQRTRLQSTTIEVEARTAHEAEGIVVDALEQGNNYDDEKWSSGENEGKIDYDMEWVKG